MFPCLFQPRFRLPLLLLAAAACAHSAPPPLPACAATAFERNHGQAPPEVRYLARTVQGTLALCPDRAVLTQAGSQLAMVFQGAAPTPALSAEQPLPGLVSYFGGADRDQQRLATSAAVRYHDLYPGTDARFHGRGGALEYDFLLRPGARPERIRLGFPGARSLRLDRHGDLLIGLATGTLRQRRPSLHQEGAGQRRTVSGRFRLLPGKTVGFQVGRYDRRRTLVIDPVLDWIQDHDAFPNTGNLPTSGFTGVTLDAAGNLYAVGRYAGPVAGAASAVTLAAGPGSLGSGLLLKLDPAGSVVYCCHFRDAASLDRVALGPGGRVHVAGSNLDPSAQLPGGSGPQTAHLGGAAIYLAGLDEASLTLGYQTFLGGTQVETVSDLVVAPQGHLFLAGTSTSAALAGLSAAAPAPLPAHPPFPRAYRWRAAGAPEPFLVRLSADGHSWERFTYLGGNGNDSGPRLALDGNGDLRAAGTTDSLHAPLDRAVATDFPATEIIPADPGLFNGQSFGFVLAASPDLQRLRYATLLGGSDHLGTGILALAVDATGGNLVSGWSQDSDLFTGSWATAVADPSAAGGDRASNGGSFVARIDADGRKLEYLSYVGWLNSSSAALAVDAAGSALLAATTAGVSTGLASTTLPGNAPLSNAHPNRAILLKLGPQGDTLDMCSFLGPAVASQALAVAVNADGVVVAGGAVGASPSSNFRAPLLARILTSARTLSIEPTPAVVTVNDQITCTATRDGQPLAALHWSASLGRMDPDGTWTAPAAPASVVTLTAQDHLCAPATSTLEVVEAPRASSLLPVTGSPASPDYGATLAIVPVFSGGTAVLGSEGPGSDNLAGAGDLVSGQPFGWQVLATATLTLTVSNAAGRSDSTSLAVPAPSIVLDPALPQFVTVGRSLAFNAAVQGGSHPGFSFLVDDLPGGSAEAGRIDASGRYTAPAEPGSHIVTVAATQNAALQAATPVEVLAALAPPELSAPAMVLPGHAGYLAEVPAQDLGTTYTWTVLGATLTEGKGTERILFALDPAATGPVQLTCVLGNAAGDRAEASVTVPVGRTQAVPLSLHLDSSLATLLPGATRTFTASTTDAAGVVWSLAPGDPGQLLASTAQEALVQAPASGTLHLTASCRSDPQVRATVRIQVLTGTDNQLGLEDLPDFLDAYGSADLAEDLTGDGWVDDQDLLDLLNSLFGPGAQG